MYTLKQCKAYLSTPIYHLLFLSLRSHNSRGIRSLFIRQWIGSTLVQIMACRLFGPKPLSEPTRTHCQLGHLVQTSVKFKSKYKKISFIKNTFEKMSCFNQGKWVNAMVTNILAHCAARSPGATVFTMCDKCVSLSCQLCYLSDRIWRTNKVSLLA